MGTTSSSELGDDDSLLVAARSGDKQALEELLSRHQAQIYRFGMTMCRDPEDAKDVLQNTLLAMARGVGSFRGASSISTWLYTIARSFCIKTRRKRKLAPEQLQSLDSDSAHEARKVTDPSQGADEVLAGKEITQALAAAIDALEPMYREVLILRDVEGLSAPEVAEVLGITVDAVKSRLHRARLSVRAHVSPLLGIPTETEAPVPTTPCPDVLLLFSQHLENEISSETCAEMERHLATCSRCSGTCESLKRTLTLCRSAAAAEVPTAVRDSVRVAVQDFIAQQR